MYEVYHTNKKMKLTVKIYVLHFKKWLKAHTHLAIPYTFESLIFVLKRSLFLLP